ncbi:MAG: Fic family protein [Bdellovibrionales bacterium]
MTWNWQQEGWPKFRYDNSALAAFEARFLEQSGLLIGAAKHMNEETQQQLVVELITDEAVDTSRIEGDYLDRDSVQSSVLRNFGLKADNKKVQPAERGIADMMTDLYKNFDVPLSHQTLYAWHKKLAHERGDLSDVGRYRSHDEPMQVVSGSIGKPKIHFEAPPSKDIKKEMDAFLLWWKQTSKQGEVPLAPLVRTGIAHLYFVSIHPFEDGNGRIARALSEKALAEHLGVPSMIALSQTIGGKRKAYYEALERNNKGTEITDWLIYFADTVLASQQHSIDLVDFLIQKTKLYDKVKSQLNERQDRVLARVFKEGLHGFKGGVSAENYIKITGVSRATATRDLQDLVEKDVFIKTGMLKSTRYHLNVSMSSHSRDRKRKTP